MSGLAQLRYVVGLFAALGIVSLLAAAINLTMSAQPSPIRAVVAVGYLVAAWFLWNGSTPARVGLAIMSVLTAAVGLVAGLLTFAELPVISLVLILMSAASSVAAWFLIFSKQLATTMRMRRLSKHAANRRAFEETVADR